MSDPTPSASGRPSPFVPRPSALLSLSLSPSASFRLSLSFSSVPLYRFISHRTPNPLSLSLSLPLNLRSIFLFLPSIFLRASRSPRLSFLPQVSTLLRCGSRASDGPTARGGAERNQASLDRSIDRSPPIHRRPLFFLSLCAQIRATVVSPRNERRCV